MKFNLPVFKRFQSLALLMVFLFALHAKASDLIEVLPVTNKIIRLTFDDGYIQGRGTGNDIARKWPLDLNDAMLSASYFITSSSDDNYTDGQAPVELGRKSKIHDISSKCDWSGSKCLNDYVEYHFIYLVLP